VEVSTIDAPADIEALLGTGRVLTRDRVYAVEGRRVQSATSYLPADLVAGTPIERPDSGPGGTYARLRDLGHEPVKFVEQVRVRMPRPDERKLLHLDVGQPVAAIRRTAATAEGRVVEVNDMVLLGEAYVMQWSFTA
jgi:GntR family transcriptional regulator